jgi:hypothetical protein
VNIVMNFLVSKKEGNFLTRCDCWLSRRTLLNVVSYKRTTHRIKQILRQFNVTQYGKLLYFK